MIEKFRKKLRVENRSLKWFIEAYLPKENYSTISLQVNGFSTLQKYTEDAIEKYLNEKQV